MLRRTFMKWVSGLFVSAPLYNCGMPDIPHGTPSIPKHKGDYAGKNVVYLGEHCSCTSGYTTQNTYFVECEHYDFALMTTPTNEWRLLTLSAGQMKQLETMSPWWLFNIRTEGSHWHEGSSAFLEIRIDKTHNINQHIVEIVMCTKDATKYMRVSPEWAIWEMKPL